jgi:dsRNA-specific ribonuclease
MTTSASSLVFKQFLRSKLRIFLPSRYVDLLSNEKNLKIFQSAFTSEEVNPQSNYEYFEQMGDVSANKFLVYYFYRRFPRLKCSRGVKVVARLKINYASKKVFARLAEQEGFWPHIMATREETQHNRLDLLEDVFEAFVGATEWILDTDVKEGVGAVAITKWLTHIFDKEHVSLRYEDLYDAKTRLKELFDRHHSVLGKVYYSETREIDANGNPVVTTSRVYRRVLRGRCVSLGVGVARLKADAQRAAAQQAIYELNAQGFTKPVPEEYAIFQDL